MTTLRTDLGNLRESARRIRFEPVSPFVQTNVQKAIEEILGLPAAITPTFVEDGDLSGGTYTVQPSDTLLLVNCTTACEIQLQAAADRNGVPLSIKDISGAAATNNITITPDGAEEIDGLAALVINADYGGYKLNPQTGGYFIL